ncbi:hypothetical protein, partial [Enterococcus faecium]|uniref:hypothetical protein n=1 Tax=Enterococcus faecium TaxID=1352 RepID=UPI003F88631D
MVGGEDQVDLAERRLGWWSVPCPALRYHLDPPAESAPTWVRFVPPPGAVGLLVDTRGTVVSARQGEN